MKDLGIVKVNWKVAGVFGYQIFELDNYTYKIGENLEDPDISLVINDEDLGKRFLNGETVKREYAVRRDYKGKFKWMHIIGFKDIETEKGMRRQKLTKHFLTAKVYNENFGSDDGKNEVWRERIWSLHSYQSVSWKISKSNYSICSF